MIQPIRIIGPVILFGLLSHGWNLACDPASSDLGKPRPKHPMAPSESRIDGYSVSIDFGGWGIPDNSTPGLKNHMPMPLRTYMQARE